MRRPLLVLAILAKYATARLSPAQQRVVDAAVAERDALARRIDNVRTMCADAQMIGGLLRPDAVLALLDGEDAR